MPPSFHLALAARAPLAFPSTPQTPLRLLRSGANRTHLLLGILLVPSLAAAQPRAFGGTVAPPFRRRAAGVRAVPGRRGGDAGGGAVRLHRGGRRHCGVPARRDAGGGAGGGHVLLLERGGAPSEFPALATAGGFVRTLAMADPAPESDAPAQGFTSEDGVPNVRARVLGGGTAINAGFYSRAHPEWFRGHAEDAEVTNWDMRLVNASYEWVERQMTFQPTVRGFQAAVRAALLEANVTPWNGFTVDHIAGTKVGATTFDASGRRHSAADLLAFARPSRLRVAIRATVTRIITNPIDPAARHGRSPQPTIAAIGVVYQDRLLDQHQAFLRPGGEVILSAGALGSPQLLLLSGIGPASDLSYLGIPVSADIPDVGKHMFDNPRNGISIIPSVPIDHSLIQVVGIPSANGAASYLEAASYIVPLAPALRSAGPFIGSSSPLYVTVATIMEKVPGPLSEGSLWLSSTNPLESPPLRFNYLSRPEDLARCVLGVRRVAEVLEGRALDGFRSPAAARGRFVCCELPHTRRRRIDDSRRAWPPARASRRLRAGSWRGPSASPRQAAPPVHHTTHRPTGHGACSAARSSIGSSPAPYPQHAGCHAYLRRASRRRRLGRFSPPRAARRDAISLRRGKDTAALQRGRDVPGETATSRRGATRRTHGVRTAWRMGAAPGAAAGRMSREGHGTHSLDVSR
ncbi:(R)-mandelonitrile lyase-like [Panicum miliaceum]|uniref:(R)-mandelonitrile lyase-like n=1 Tax=Panicum miliaceum TaxID=4540 RepID=A0A3L6RX62_PANMI|nr:(R)-mandelonitrile lyase-like [Panicum miliaceum]